MFKKISHHDSSPAYPQISHPQFIQSLVLLYAFGYISHRSPFLFFHFKDLTHKPETDQQIANLSGHPHCEHDQHYNITSMELLAWLQSVCQVNLTGQWVPINKTVQMWYRHSTRYQCVHILEIGVVTPNEEKSKDSSEERRG